MHFDSDKVLYSPGEQGTGATDGSRHELPAKNCENIINIIINLVWKLQHTRLNRLIPLQQST